jgi:serine/threonine-protein kinase
MADLEQLKAALAGRYTIEREVGSGGMATVYLAEDVKHHRKVAIKVLRPELAAALGPERFLREVEVTASLSHPHILPLLDSGDAGGFLYYVMPFVDGESLRDRLNREKQLPIDDILRITCEVATGLNYAHEHDVVHRDIKPENILLAGGTAVLADFGIAQAIRQAGEQRLTGTGLAVGTPAYMSPEQAVGEQVDGRSDVYALACVVYEMLGGNPPYDGPTPGAILARQLAGDILPLARIRTNVTPALDDTLRRALDHTPADRYQTAEEFAEAVSARLRRRSLRASLEHVRQLPRQVPLRYVVAGGALLAFVLVAIVTWQFWWVGRLAASDRPASLVVLPFRASGDDVSGLGPGVADLLAATLEGTVGIQVADPTTIWRAFRRSGDDGLRVPQLDEAIALANEISASTALLGTVTAVGRQLVVTARLYDRDGDLRNTIRSAASSDSLHALINRLALDIVAEVWERDTLPSVPVIERLATDNISALQAYLQAKSFMYRGLHTEADQAIAEAVALDTTFALAYLEQFRIRSTLQFQNAQPFTGLRPIIDQAMRYRERLSERNRLRVEANRALDDTDAIEAAALFGRVLSIDSLDWDALNSLAYTYLTHGWQIDKRFPDVIAAYERVARADPQDGSAYATLLRLSVWAGDHESAGRHAAALVDRDTSSPYAISALGTYRVTQATGQVQDSILRWLASQPLPTVTTVLRDLRSADPDLADRFLAELMADTMATLQQRVGLGARTQLWFGMGRVAANDSVVRKGDLATIRQTVNGFFVTSLLAGVGDNAAAARAVAELELFAPAESLSVLLESRDVWTTGWAVAAYHAAVGDTVKAHRWQAALADLPQGQTPWDWTGSLEADIESRLAVRAGNVERAEAAAREAFERWTIHSYNVLESHPEPGMRFHLAQILQARGDIEAAARLYRSFVPPHNWAGFYTARSAYELGRIAETQRDLPEAAYYYSVALALWRLGGDEVASWRDQAQARLEQTLSQIG